MLHLHIPQATIPVPGHLLSRYTHIPWLQPSACKRLHCLGPSPIPHFQEPGDAHTMPLPPAMTHLCTLQVGIYWKGKIKFALILYMMESLLDPPVSTLMDFSEAPTTLHQDSTLLPPCPQQTNFPRAAKLSGGSPVLYRAVDREKHDLRSTHSHKERRTVEGYPVQGARSGL